jgi:hypothetical protein
MRAICGWLGAMPDGTEKPVERLALQNGNLYPNFKDGNSLSIYAAYLDSNSHIKALQMFHTIRYK